MKPKGEKRAIGVARHIYHRKVEVHLWHKTSPGIRKGAQVYVGAYATFEEGVRAYDIAAIALKVRLRAHLERARKTHARVSTCLHRACTRLA